MSFWQEIKPKNEKKKKKAQNQDIEKEEYSLEKEIS